MTLTSSHTSAREKRSFIRAAEIWLPDEDGTTLTLGTGLYGPLTGFAEVAASTRFAFDEGLPGKAWASGQPIVLKNLTNSYFVRAAAAIEANLTCGVALPIFDGEALRAVIVFFCGDDRDHVGAIEVWHADADDVEMSLVDGYYGTAEVFEWTARHISFMKGSGLPGQVWASGMPVIMEALRGPRFVRWEEAARAGISRGVGIPCATKTDGVWVMTFLSALHTPIATRFEVWVPDAGELILHAGFCERSGDLAADYAEVRIPRDLGALGTALDTEAPALTLALEAEHPAIALSTNTHGLSNMLVIPLFGETGLSAVMAWYN
ncbi:GAF domain-containing protein [Acuticoccus kandeliae]|uniref:GAF domain-containing protein n=1 Tax=Acuticoccus kandeliae TaxID=2073160 RepID=UPI000D3E98F2|nr:GAF domain-containing protein [Acuticoccus kandeliae]